MKPPEESKCRGSCFGGLCTETRN